MTKFFISQSMRGLSQREIKERREFLTDLIADNFSGAIVLDSFLEGAKDVDPLVCLGHAITIMSKADAVVFDTGWQKARGCKIEYEIAKAYGKQIYFIIDDEGPAFLPPEK